MRWMLLVCVGLGFVTPAAAERPPTATELISRGEVHEARSQFAAAIKLYVELEKLPSYTGIAKYLQARAHYLNHDLDRAQTLTMTAIPATSDPWKLKAKLLYAEILFKKGETRRAKEFFLALHRQQTGQDRAELEMRIIACNRQLRLEDRDGL